MDNFKVGDRVRVIDDYNRDYIGKTGGITVDDKSGIPFIVRFDNPVNGNKERWFREDKVEKINDANPSDDWRARFEAFKASHPVGSKVKVARKVTDDGDAPCWAGSMDKNIGKVGTIVAYNIYSICYTISVDIDGGDCNQYSYPVAALEDVTNDVTENEHEYAFYAKSGDIDLNRIWKEANPDFAVVVDYDKNSPTVYILHRNLQFHSGYVVRQASRSGAEKAVEELKRKYDNERKQRVVVTVY